jgi:hypothetical protein
MSILVFACGGAAPVDPPASRVELSVTVNGPGSVSGPQGISCPSQCSVIVERGTTMTLTTTGNVLAWQGCQASGETCSLTLDAATNVVVDFRDQQAPAASITISPDSASLQIGGSQQFTAQVTNAQDTTVDWSVQEGDTGGSVTPAGFYQAPLTDGSFHVVARSRADSSKSATRCNSRRR